jgi:hypothetical protein
MLPATDLISLCSHRSSSCSLARLARPGSPTAEIPSPTCAHTEWLEYSVSFFERLKPMSENKEFHEMFGLWRRILINRNVYF